MHLAAVQPEDFTVTYEILIGTVVYAGSQNSVVKVTVTYNSKKSSGKKQYNREEPKSQDGLSQAYICRSSM